MLNERYNVKRYDVLLKIAKSIYKMDSATDNDKEQLIVWFPDLLDTEDEKIRKEIVEELYKQSLNNTDEKQTEQYTKWLDWLNQQRQFTMYEGKELSECDDNIRDFMEIFCEDKPKPYWDGCADVLEWLRNHPTEVEWIVGSDGLKQIEDNTPKSTELSDKNAVCEISADVSDKVSVFADALKHTIDEAYELPQSEYMSTNLMADAENLMNYAVSLTEKKQNTEQKTEVVGVKVPERISPKFAVGDTIQRERYADHTIKEIFIKTDSPVYVCVNDEGEESHINLNEQDDWTKKTVNMLSKEDTDKMNRLWIILGSCVDSYPRIIGDKECVELQDWLMKVKEKIEYANGYEWSQEDVLTMDMIEELLIKLMDFDESYSNECFDGIKWMKMLRPSDLWKPVDEPIYVSNPVIAQTKDQSDLFKGCVLCADHTLKPDKYVRYIELKNIFDVPVAKKINQ